MSNPTERIKSLLNKLPERDIPIGERLLKLRDFESLKELTDSAITKIDMNFKKKEPSHKYDNVDIEGLTTLKSEIDSYLELIGLPELDEYVEYNNY